MVRSLCFILAMSSLLTLPQTTMGRWSRVKAGINKDKGVIDIFALNADFAAFAGVTSTGMQDSSMVLMTHDGGKTWTSAVPAQSTNPLDIHIFSSVWFEDEMHGYIGGAGELFTTTDGGQTFLKKNLGGALSGKLIVDIHSAAPQSGVFAVSSLGEVYLTTDGGKDWAVAATPLGKAALTKVQFFDEKTGWVSAGTKKRDIKTKELIGYKDGGLARTLDGGKNWEVLFSGEEREVKAISFIDANRGWLVSETMQGPKLEQTSDGGRTWIPAAFPKQTQVGEVKELIAVQFFDACEGWLMGNAGLNDGGVLWHTTDYGETWSELEDRQFLKIPNPIGLPLDATLAAMSFADRHSGWVSGSYETLFRYQADSETPLCSVEEQGDATKGKAPGAPKDIEASENAGGCQMGPVSSKENALFLFLLLVLIFRHPLRFTAK